MKYLPETERKLTFALLFIGTLILGIYLGYFVGVFTSAYYKSQE